MLQRLSLRNGVAYHLGVMLRDLVELPHSRTDLAQACVLLGAGAGYLGHAGRHAANAAGHVGNARQPTESAPCAGSTWLTEAPTVHGTARRVARTFE